MDVRENTAGRDRDRAQELVELLVVADGELDVARHDARLLVVRAVGSLQVVTLKVCLVAQRWLQLGGDVMGAVI